jgi:hypothetical protein
VDDADFDNLGKGKIATTANNIKSGLEPVKQATGIPKPNSLRVMGKNRWCKGKLKKNLFVGKAVYGYDRS